MAWRLIKGLLRLVIGLVVVATLAGAYLFWRAMPIYSGSEKLPGLSAEVRVWRDAYGVPHIFAASMDDAARALGYVHASERLFEMEVQRRVGQGRMSEFRGADLVNVDKYIRTLGLYREAEASFAALSPPTQKRLQAYADGVNAFLDSHKDALPPEFLIIGDEPGTLEACKLAGLRQAAVVAALQQLQARDPCGRICVKSSVPNGPPGCFPD